MDPGGRTLAIYGGDGDIVAFTHSDERGRANAQLMACAPGMLRALELVHASMMGKKVKGIDNKTIAAIIKTAKGEI